MRTVLLMICMMIPFIHALATKHAVTLSTDDADNPQPGMLRYWIANASSGDTITFTVSRVDLDTTIRINGGKITIDGGNGVIIDGKNKVRVFNISAYSFDNIILKNLTIQNGYLNNSTAMGGGMYAYAGFGDLKVENCTFINNRVVSSGDGQGGGLRSDGGTFINCFFLNNEVSGTTSILGGGGVFAIEGTFINCIIAGNSAGYGGGVYTSTSSIFNNCTVTQNAASNNDGGGGVNCEDNCTLINCIIYNNTSTSGSHNIFNYLGTSLFSHCALESGNSLVGTYGNIGLSTTPFTHAGDDSLSIPSTSPCFDAGTTNGITITPHDIAGNPRISGESIDIGAYEYKVPSYSAITVTNNSSDPAVEYSLPWAIAHADKGGVITFDNSYQIKVTTEIDINKGITIDGSGHTVVLDGEGKRHLLNITGAASDTVYLKNLWIQNANQTADGGAIYAYGMNNVLIIVNCVFENNVTGYSGGALTVFCKGKIVNSTFYGNKALNSGGAVCSGQEVAIINCLFYNNHAKNEKDIFGTGAVSHSASDGWLQGEGNVYLWSNPFTGGSGLDRFHLNSVSYCANAGTPDTEGLHLPSTDASGNQRIQKDTIDIGAFESSFNTTPPRLVYSNITVTNNSPDAATEYSLLWAISHAGENCTISFSNDFVIPITRTVVLDYKSIVIEGGENKIFLDGGDTIRIFQVFGTTGKTITLNNLTLQNGYSYSYGGGIFADIQSGGNLVLNKCSFFDNNSGFDGGGIYLLFAFSETEGCNIKNCVFTGNHTGSRGGALYTYNNTLSSSEDIPGVSIFNCTFANNCSDYEGGGINTQGTHYIKNCLFYNNPSPNGKSIWSINGSRITYCAADVPLIGENNVRLYSTPFAQGGILLNDTSYCANAGTPDITGLGLPLTDLAGNNRIMNNRIDIGAYESGYNAMPSLVLYDRITVTNNSFNVSVPNSLPWALMHAAEVCSINFDNNYTIPVSSQMILGNKSITIDGGEHEIRLDGGDSTRLILVEGNDYFTYKEVNLNNLILQHGKAPDNGGAVFIDVYALAKLTVTNCVFYKNTGRYGGAVYAQNANEFINCVFIQNSASINGGGAYSYRDTKFINCTFTGNYADQSGGGITTYSNNVVNSLLYGNVSRFGKKDVYDRYQTEFTCSASGDDLTALGDGNIILAGSPFKKGAGIDSLSLTTGSACINAGKPDAAGLHLPYRDINHISRIIGNTVDIGAYEYYDHIIQTTTSTGGQIVPGPAYVIDSRDQTLSIVPDPGFYLDSVWADNVFTDSTVTYTFRNVKADHLLRATFVPDTFNIIAIAGEHGTVDPGDTSITVLDTMTFIITPYEGYEVTTATFGNKNVLNDLAGTGGVFTYTVSGVVSDDTLAITFSSITYTITTIVTGNGSVSPPNPVVNYGSGITFTLTPGEGEEIISATYAGNDITGNLIPSGNAFTYTMDLVYADDTLRVEFTGISGIESIDADEFSFYPNPTSGMIHINMPDQVKNYALAVVDNNGKINLISSEYGEKDINLSELPSGYYMLIIEFNSQRISMPLIKY